MSKERVLIIGAEGQLGSEFDKQLSRLNYNYLAPREMECNLMTPEQIKHIVNEYSPTITINCAAFNAVDEAEDDEKLALDVNYHAVKNLAEIVNTHGSRLIHYSSDYVFDGTKQNLYEEDDRTNPLNNYGKSKLAGEQTVLDCSADFLVFRLSWVIGKGKQNFLHKLSHWAETQKILKISADEVSVPTFTDEIVRLTLKSIEYNLKGLYHMTNSDYASRYELARFYFDHVGIRNLIVPVAMSHFKTKAERPLFSAMSNRKLSKALNTTIPNWREGLTNFLKE